MEDKLIICEHCGSEMCYSTKISDTAWAYNCAGCGFTANDLIKDGEYDVETFEEALPELYKDLKFIGESGKAWYPLVLNDEGGVVFVNGTDKDNWAWSAIKNRPLTEEEQQVYINEDKEVPEFKSDSNTLKSFGKLGFLEALNYVGMA